MSGPSSEILKRIYFDTSHPAGYGGAGRLAAASKLPIKRVREWLKSQPSYTLHKPARKRGYKTRKYLVSGIDHQWQADLVDMQVEGLDNEGYKYILTVVDIFSRYAWAEPVKTKSPKDVKPAFEKIFAKGRKPLKIQTDQGLEFESRTMKDFFQRHKIEQFSVKSQFKASLVERFNGTLKTKMWHYFTYANTRKWLKILPKLVSAYNQAKHRMIKMAPNEVNADVEMELWKRNEDEAIKGVNMRRRRVEVDDWVRLSKVKGPFAKGYLPNWTEEVFKVVSVSNGNPVQIRIKDYANNLIEGSYYQEEVQVVTEPKVFNIEAVLQTRNVGRGRKEYLVKWLGYPNQFNSWVGEDQFVSLNNGS